MGVGCRVCLQWLEEGREGGDGDVEEDEAEGADECCLGGHLGRSRGSCKGVVRGGWRRGEIRNSLEIGGNFLDVTARNRMERSKDSVLLSRRIEW